MAEHRSLQPRDGPGLDIPVSPVLQPRGQVPSSSSSRSPIKSHDQAPVDNFPQSNNSEEEDFQLALQLSQEEERDKEQEERDRELALRLQEEFNRENVPPSARMSPPTSPSQPFTFDENTEESRESRRRDNLHIYDDDDLPDIPDVRHPDPVRQSSSSLKMKTVSSFVSPTKLSDTNKPGPSRQKPRVIHDISVVSDDEDCPLPTTTKKPTPKKKKTPTKSPGSGRKDYVPRQRSGAYAVLITLFHEKAKDEYRGFVSKAFLQVGYCLHFIVSGRSS